MRSVRDRALLVASALSLLVGCEDDVVSFDVELVADPNLNTVSQVLERTDTIELVLDSDDGLYAPGEERLEGDVRILDVDGDAPLELVARVPVPDSRFPRIRLERGGLPRVPITIRIVGYDSLSGEVVANGALAGVEFRGGRTDLALPFNLLADELPPRVVDVVASPSSSCEAPTLTLLFSRPVDPASVVGPFAVTFDPGGAPTELRIDATGRLALITAPAAVVVGSRVAFTLTLATTIRTEDAITLDQVPSVPGDQPYVGRFDEPCSP